MVTGQLDTFHYSSISFILLLLVSVELYGCFCKLFEKITKVVNILIPLILNVAATLSTDKMLHIELDDLYTYNFADI